MNPVQSLQTFLLAAASLDSARTFYAKVDDRYQRLRSVNSGGFGLVTIGDEQFPQIPLFTLNNGIATSMEGNQSKVFGKFKRFYAVGNAELVKPFEIQLDNDSKVANFSMYLCTAPQSFLPKLFVSSTVDVPGMTCSSKDVYFLTPAEVGELEPVSKMENKTEKRIAPERDKPEEDILEENDEYDDIEDDKMY